MFSIIVTVGHSAILLPERRPLMRDGQPLYFATRLEAEALLATFARGRSTSITYSIEPTISGVATTL